jgi:hypothetical protein
MRIVWETFEEQFLQSKTIWIKHRYPIAPHQLLASSSTPSIQYVDYVRFENDDDEYIIGQVSHSSSSFSTLHECETSSNIELSRVLHRVNSNSFLMFHHRNDYALPIEFEWIRRNRPAIFVELFLNKVIPIPEQHLPQQFGLLVNAFQKLKFPSNYILAQFKTLFQAWKQTDAPINLPNVPDFGNDLNIVNIAVYDDEEYSGLDNFLQRQDTSECGALVLSSANLRTAEELKKIRDFVEHHSKIELLDLSRNSFGSDCWNSVIEILKIDRLKVLNMVGNSVVSVHHSKEFVSLVETNIQLLMKLIWIPRVLVDTGLWNCALEPNYFAHVQLINSSMQSKSNTLVSLKCIVNGSDWYLIVWIVTSSKNVSDEIQRRCFRFFFFGLLSSLISRPIPKKSHINR